MAKTKISEFSSTAGNNTDIDSINIAEGCAPSGINNAIRELMAQLKDFQAGTAGDSFNGPVGTTTAAAGAFTTLSASGAFTYGGVTLSNAVTGTGNMVLSTSPTLVTPALGTPTALVGTNITGTAANFNINGTVGATTANTGAFTTLAASGAVTLSGGTANGVAYLNGSKVLTTGSALTYNGSSAVTITGATNASLYLTSTSGTGECELRLGDVADTDAGSLAYDNSVDAMVFRAAAAERMRLTSTGLGIGTSSPTNALSVTGNANITGNTTLGDATTDTVTVNGYMGVGGAASSDAGITITSNALVGAAQSGMQVRPVATSSATTSIRAIVARSDTAAASFTVANAVNFWAAGVTKGAGSTITNQHGVYIVDQAEGINNYGITSLVSSGTNKWNIYASGTAANYFAGNVSIGQTSSALQSGGTGITLYGSTASELKFLNSTTGQTSSDGTALVATGSDFTINNRETGTLRFNTSNAERLRIDSSGNVGIGTSSPGAMLDLAANNTAGTALNVLRFTDTDGSATAPQELGKIEFYSSDASTPGAGVKASIVGIAEVGNPGGALTFNTDLLTGSPIERMRIDRFGNVGIGTSSPARPLDVRGALGMQVNEDGAGTKVLSLRSDFAGVGPAINVTTNDPLLLMTNSTERARIDSSGNLLVGTTSRVSVERFTSVTTGDAQSAAFKNDSATRDTQVVWNAATSGNNSFVTFYTETSITSRGGISYNRGAGLVAYNTTSDYRAKDIIGPVVDSGALIDSTPVYMGKIKGATQERPMFIAHETPDYAHTGEKDAVDADGNPVYQQMDVSALVPVMWAEIQSLRQRLAAAGI